MRVSIENARGQTFANDSLPPANYCVIVRDANNCVVGSQCFEVRDAAKLMATTTKTNKTCTDGGRIEVTAIGGSGTYSFRWSDLDSLNQPSRRANLSAGTYRVTVYDSKGCAYFPDSIVVKNDCATQPNCTLSSSVAPQNRTCTEGGKITLTVRGGTLPYKFDWLDLAGTSNAPNRSDLVAGTYTVIVSDAANCRDTLKNILIQNTCGDTTRLCSPPIIAGSNITAARCGQSNGEIALTLTRVDNAVFTWTPNVSTTGSAAGLAAGDYKVHVANVSDTTCFVEKQFVVKNENGAPVADPSVTAATCGLANGKAEFSTVGRALNFAWSDGGQGSRRTDLSAGRYVVTVSDPSGNFCNQIVSLEIPSSNPLLAFNTVEKRATCNAANGQATVRGSGGTGSYTFSWGSTATRTDLRAGIYNVTLTDNSTGCTAQTAVTMTNEIAAAATITMYKRHFLCHVRATATLRRRSM